MIFLVLGKRTVMIEKSLKAVIGYISSTPTILIGTTELDHVITNITMKCPIGAKMKIAIIIIKEKILLPFDGRTKEEPDYPSMKAHHLMNLLYSVLAVIRKERIGIRVKLVPLEIHEVLVIGNVNLITEVKM
jgi:hypothetical protein